MFKNISRGRSDKGKDSKNYGKYSYHKMIQFIRFNNIDYTSIKKDDPYYCGLRARVPNFGKMNNKNNGTINEKKTSFFGKKDFKTKDKEKDYKEKDFVLPKQRSSFVQMPHPASFSTLYQLHQMQNGILDTASKRGNFQRHKSQPDQYNMWHAKSYESGIG